MNKLTTTSLSCAVLAAAMLSGCANMTETQSDTAKGCLLYTSPSPRD